MKKLAGHWELMSYVTRSSDGAEGRPYGDAVGRLSYDAHGNMAGQVMRPGRPAVVHGRSGLEEVRAAYAGYIAYFGTYEVNDSQDRIVHHVQGALNPGWVGSDQVRRMAFDGDLLILSAEVPKGSGSVLHTLTWKRLA